LPLVITSNYICSMRRRSLRRHWILWFNCQSMGHSSNFW